MSPHQPAELQHVPKEVEWQVVLPKAAEQRPLVEGSGKTVGGSNAGPSLPAAPPPGIAAVAGEGGRNGGGVVEVETPAYGST